MAYSKQVGRITIKPEEYFKMEKSIRLLNAGETINYYVGFLMRDQGKHHEMFVRFCDIWQERGILFFTQRYDSITNKYYYFVTRTSREIIPIEFNNRMSQYPLNETP